MGRRCYSPSLQHQVSNAQRIEWRIDRVLTQLKTNTRDTLPDEEYEAMREILTRHAKDCDGGLQQVSLRFLTPMSAIRHRRKHRNSG
jgi:hypothetical protein